MILIPVQDTTKDDVSFFKEEFGDALIKLVPMIEKVLCARLLMLWN